MTEEELQARWEENRQAVQDAKEECLASFRRWAGVREIAFASARRRDPRYPVLNAQEKARVDRARGEVEAARAALEVARETFKAGVVE